MGVFSVPVTIGVDEEKIAQSIEKNVESQVINRVLTEVKRVYIRTDLIVIQMIIVILLR